MIKLQEIVSLLLIGIGLSMDAFSLSLGIGTYLRSNKKIIFLASSIGIFHFIMPIIGNILGNRIIIFLDIEASYILGIILIIIAIKMLIDSIKDEEVSLDLKYISLFFLALIVSVDSFITGLGLSAITANIVLGSLIFSICAFTISYLGLKLGEYSRVILGRYANYLGITILFILGIKSFFV